MSVRPFTCGHVCTPLHVLNMVRLLFEKKSSNRVWECQLWGNLSTSLSFEYFTIRSRAINQKKTAYGASHEWAKAVSRKIRKIQAARRWFPVTQSTFFIWKGFQWLIFCSELEYRWSQWLRLFFWAWKCFPMTQTIFFWAWIGFPVTQIIYSEPEKLPSG